MEAQSSKNKPTIRGLFKWWWKKKNVQGKAGSAKSDNHTQIRPKVKAENPKDSHITNNDVESRNNMLVTELKQSTRDGDTPTKNAMPVQEMLDTKSSLHPLLDSTSRDSPPVDVTTLPKKDGATESPNTKNATTLGYVFPQYDGDQSYDVETNVLFFNDTPTMYGSMPNVNIYGKKKRRRRKPKRRNLALERTQSHNVLSNVENSKLDKHPKSKRSKLNVFGRVAASLGSLTNLKRNGNSKHSDSINSNDVTSHKQKQGWRKNKQGPHKYTSDTSTVMSSPDCENKLQKTSSFSEMRSFYDSLDSGFDNRLLSEDSEIEAKSTVADVHSSAQLDSMAVVNLHTSILGKPPSATQYEQFAFKRTGGLNKSLPLLCKTKTPIFRKRSFSISNITQTEKCDGHFPVDPLLRKASNTSVIPLSPPPVLENDQEKMNDADTTFSSLAVQDSSYTANNNNNVQILPAKLTDDLNTSKLDRLKEDAVLKINQDLRKLSVKRTSFPQIKQSLTKQTKYYKASHKRSPRKIKSASLFGAPNTSKTLKKKYSDEQIVFTYDFSDTLSPYSQNKQLENDKNFPLENNKAITPQTSGISRSAKIMIKPSNQQVLKTKQNSANGSDTNLHFLSSSPSDCDSEKSRCSDIEPGHLSMGPLSHRGTSLNSEFTDVTSLASSNALISQPIKNGVSDSSFQFLFKPISPDMASSIASDDVNCDYDVFESPRMPFTRKIHPKVVKKPSFGELERDFNQFVINFNRKKNLKEKIVE